MTLMRHELRQGRVSLAIWTGAIACLLITCIFLFPEMKGEMQIVGNLFASMGSFTAAFGMDRLNFGYLSGFYAVECGNVLGLGGALFAAMCGVAVLAKEEKDHTAEFLLTHPVSRKRIVTEKLCAVLIQVTVLNAVTLILALASIAAIGEKIPWKEILLMHLAYYLLMLEISGICFGISAFLRRGGLGIGLGIAAMMYFLNLIANISDSAKFLKYITPFGYTEGADIVTSGKLDPVLLGLGMLYGVLGICAAYRRYCKKDIQ